MTKIFYFRFNLILDFLTVIFSFFSLSLLFVLFSFLIHTNNYFTTVNEEFDNVQIFHLNELVGGIIYGQSTENDPLWLQSNGLERLKSFYYDVLLLAEFSVAPVNNSQFLEIRVDEFFGGEAFQLGYEEGWNAGKLPFEGNYFYQIKAVTLNQFAWELLPVEIASGRGFQDEDFGVISETIPIVLGYQYMNYYNIGDLIAAYYAAIDLEFEVIGFLAENQVIFLDTSDYFVDFYILIPFVTFGEAQTAEERDFQGFYYTMKALNTYIFVEDTPESINHMYNVIHVSSEELDFSYFFSLMDHTIIRHHELNNLIHHHTEVVQVLLYSSMVLLAAIIVILTRIKYNNQRKLYAIYMMMGISRYKQIAMIVLLNAVVFALIIFSVLYYAVFYSDIILVGEQLIFFAEHGISRWSVFWEYITFDIFGFHHVSLQRTALFGILLFLISIIYPVLKINKLYGGRAKW